MITVKNEQKIPVNVVNLKKDAKKILHYLGYSQFDLGILLTEMDHIHQLNKQYRDKDKPTDILSFPYYPTVKAGEKIVATKKEDKNLGDIIICPTYVQKDLARWNQSFGQRMQTLLVHGICHLLGYDHIKNQDYIIMHQKEAEIIAILDK